MTYRYFEIMLDYFYSICIRGIREPNFKEAEEFLSSDLRGRRVIYIEEWERNDAETAFDFSREAEWPVFGIKN